MNEEIPTTNPPLTATERVAAGQLTAAELQAIDAGILANAALRWRKVARVVTLTEDALRKQFPDLSYRFYSLRLIELATEGRLEAKGDLRYIRFSEVRIPNSLAESVAS